MNARVVIAFFDQVNKTMSDRTWLLFWQLNDIDILICETTKKSDFVLLNYNFIIFFENLTIHVCRRFILISVGIELL